MIETTPYSHCASLSSGAPTTHKTFLMYRRAPDSQALNTLGVTDISLLMPSKGEVAPHTFCKVDKNLNTGMVQLLPVHHLANLFQIFLRQCSLPFYRLRIAFYYAHPLCFLNMFSFLFLFLIPPFNFLYFCLLWFWLSCFCISFEYLFLKDFLLRACVGFCAHVSVFVCYTVGAGTVPVL